MLWYGGSNRGMSEPAHEDPAAIEFDREEAWVVHTALLTSIEADLDAGEESSAEIRLLREVEADAAFDTSELALVRDALVAYLGDAPLRDRAPGRAALRRIHATIGGEAEGASI